MSYGSRASGRIARKRALLDLTDPSIGSERIKVESAAADESAWPGGRGMRHLLNQLSLMLSAVLLVSCASAIPPARIGEYVPSEHRAGDDAFRRINQRPLQAGLVVVSDMAEPGAAPNLPEEALTRLGESLQRDLGRAIPVAIIEVVSADHIRTAAAWGLGPVRRTGTATRARVSGRCGCLQHRAGISRDALSGMDHARAAWISSR